MRYFLRQNPIREMPGIRSQALFSHLKETEWRFNHRLDNIYSILLKQTRHFPL